MHFRVVPQISSVECGDDSHHVKYNTMSTDLLDLLTAQLQQYEAAVAKEKFPWKFETVPGYFKQLLPETDDKNFDHLGEHFGKLKPWKQTLADIQKLNDESPDNVVYKLLLLGRHGQGYHNLADLKYGEKAWNEYWLRRTGDGEIVWAPDAELTDLGIQQAQDNHKQFKIELEDGLELPTRWFSSPFRRSIDTLIGTWDGFVDLQKVKPYIMEDFRETIGVHLCDKRLPRRVIAEKYEKKGFVIEDGFEEEDIYYKDDYREQVWEQAFRTNRGFQHVFDSTDKFADQVVSVTSHSGTIRTQLIVLGHRVFFIETGGLIPVVVKATRD